MAVRKTRKTASGTTSGRLSSKPKVKAAAKGVAKPQAKSQAKTPAKIDDKSPASALAKASSVPATTPSTSAQPIYVLSDSTGNLGRHILTAILTQFPAEAFRLESRNFLRSEEEIRHVMNEVRERPGMVFHGLLDKSHKVVVHDACAKSGVGACDLTGPFVDFISAHSGLESGGNHELLHHIDEAYRLRIKALEFALEHDDALGLDSLGEADIVLVGVSRTSKTPTSIFLAQQGYRTANIALAIQVEPPQQLLELRGHKVVGLVIDPSTLSEIRGRRREEWRMDATSYTDPREVAREVAWSRQLFARQGWPILDVTNQAIEETAARIVHALGLTRPGVQ